MKIDEFLKDEKNLDKAASQDGSLDDDALEAVAGGIGDLNSDDSIKVYGCGANRDFEGKNRYDERNDSGDIRRKLISVREDLIAPSGGISL